MIQCYPAPILTQRSIDFLLLQTHCGEIIKPLHGAWIENSQGKRFRIHAHSVTGETQSSEELIAKLSKPPFQNGTTFHVIVGTSAIQEGISMNWATTVVHWDLPTNPQTLEQRTWRLDRHRTANDSDRFNVVYIVTDSKSDKAIIERLRKRSKIASSILDSGRYNSLKWPQEYPPHPVPKNSEPHLRDYEGTEVVFFHKEEKTLAETWGLNTNRDGPGFEIRLKQQKALFAGLFSLQYTTRSSGTSRRQTGT